MSSSIRSLYPQIIPHYLPRIKHFILEGIVSLLDWRRRQWDRIVRVEKLVVVLNEKGLANGLTI